MSRHVTVANVGELEDGARRCVDVAGREVTVLRQGERYYALRNRCPHANGRLGDGVIQDDTIVCPLHQWKFRLSDGGTRRDPRLRAEVLPVRIEGDDVQVEVPEPWDEAPGEP